MNATIDATLYAGEILSSDEADAPVDAWSLDELDRFADLDSVHAAWSRTDNVD